MKLMQIKLSGFKSFVDTTVIDIQGQLVGIVGPNGCGKSNVIDAVRWVLGESSARQLRGESMQDVIFNGSVSRKAVSRASVELVFNNERKILSAMWNEYAEISIKRLLSRKGESLYYINNQIVRRRDITDLFLGTGVGSKGYAVIEQGMISRIIDAKPEELRIYLEEAAGVSKYREKRKETLSRLEYTKENMVRLQDINSELADNILKLSDQAEVAENYQNLTIRLKNLQLLALLLRMQKSRFTLNDADISIENYEKSLTQNLNQKQAIHDQLDKKYDQKSIQEPRLAKLTEEFNNLRSNIARLEERQNNSVKRLTQLNQEKEHYHKQVLQIDEQINVISDSTKLANSSIEINNDKVVELQLTFDAKQDDYTATEDDKQVSSKVLTDIAKHVSQEQQELSLFNNTLTHKKQQLHNLNTRLKKLEQETVGNILDLDRAYHEIKDEISRLNIELEGLHTQIDSDKHSISAFEAKKAESLTLTHQLKNQISGTSAKIATLNQLLARQNNSYDLSKVLANPEALSPLWKNIEVESGYEVAVEAALGNLLSGISLTSLDELIHEPSHALVLWHASTKSPHVIGSLATKVKIKDEKFAGIYVLLNQFTLADDFRSGLQYVVEGISRVVTQSGHILTSEYISFNGENSNNHVLEYQNQQKELSVELLDLEQQLATTEENYAYNLKQFNLVLEKYTSRELEYKLKQKEQHQLQLEFTKQEQNHLHMVRHQEKISHEITTIKNEITYVEDELTDFVSKIEEHELLLEDLLNRQEQAKLQHHDKEVQYTRAKNGLLEIETQINHLNSENRLLGQQLSLAAKQIIDKQSQRETVCARISEIEHEEVDLKADRGSVELDIARSTIGELAEEINQESQLLKQLGISISESKNELSKLEQSKSVFQDKLNQARLKQQESLISLHNYQESIDALEVDVYDADTLLLENKLSLAEIQSQVASLKSQIEAMGLVNLKAIEDLSLAQAKFEDLTSQIQDLSTAIETLEQAIMQIDASTRKMLSETYTKVNETFNVYFKLLFGGGGAKLELTEGDILVAGMQIYAEPLGKKNSSIHLLSGGEKALTAMSLVFALFNLNPAPFCILDEVDAPLDDANTLRFCRLVKELSERTQFIYISHNRLTMEMAEQLVGVTMQEKGVSTTVSVTLVDSIKHIDA